LAIAIAIVVTVHDVLACVCRHEHLFRDKFDLEEVYNVSTEQLFNLLTMTHIVNCVITYC